MKKNLQNNFTTPEQSKRLLELGVPAWTADCYYRESGKIEIKNTALDELYPACWSVGRLIEICLSVFETHYCAPKAIKITTASLYGAGLIEDCVRKLEELHESYIVDFSKLEEKA